MILTASLACVGSIMLVEAIDSKMLILVFLSSFCLSVLNNTTLLGRASLSVEHPLEIQALYDATVSASVRHW